MATDEQIQAVSEHMRKSNPDMIFNTLNEGNAGIGAALRCLYDSSCDVTAGRISQVLRVSTARVAVLLKKMADKGLITKQADSHDARVTLVHLSEEGMNAFREMHAESCRKIGAVIDRVGMERMMEFMELSDEIEAAVQGLKGRL